MNDFYDIWAISHQFAFEGITLAEALNATLRNRGTTANMKLSDLFSEAFAEEKRDLWNAYIMRIGQDPGALPEFNLILGWITEFAQPVLDALGGGGPLERTWDPDRGWS